MLSAIIQLLKPILALVTGAAVWEGFKFFYPSLTQRLKNYREGRKAFFSGLDPILKAADELYGKIYSLAKEDFSTFINPAHAYAEDIEHNKNMLFIFLRNFGHNWNK